MGWVVNAALPPGKTRCPLYRRLDGPLGRSGRCGVSRPHRDSIPWTVQPVASRYTDWAIPAPCLCGEIIVNVKPRTNDSGSLKCNDAMQRSRVYFWTLLLGGRKWSPWHTDMLWCRTSHYPLNGIYGRSQGLTLLGNMPGIDLEHCRKELYIECSFFRMS